MTDVLVAGETLIDFLPDAPGPLAAVESFSRRAGGAPANVAVGLSHLDADVAFWTRIGDDPFGDYLADALDGHGLPGTYIERDPEAKTTLAFVSLGADADREFSFYRERSADTRMEPGAVPDADLADTDWVHADALSLDSEPSRGAVLDLMERAGEAGATVSFDPNARPERWDEFSFRESVERGFGLADAVKATPADLREAGFAGDAPELARRVCEFGPHTCLLTLGAEGAYAYATADAPWSDAGRRDAGGEGRRLSPSGGRQPKASGDGVERSSTSSRTPGSSGDSEAQSASGNRKSQTSGDGTTEVSHGGYAVDPVDTTGAGDAFTAGSIAALSSGESLGETLAFANAVAATATTAAGAMTALPSRGEVRTFRDERA